MRSVRILMAGFFGLFLDMFLTELMMGIGLSLLGLRLNDYALLQLGFSNPNVPHLVVGLLVPLLATMVGGAAAGVLAPQDPHPAGALVGGLGLIMVALWGMEPNLPYARTRIVEQYVATVLAALCAGLMVRYRARAQG